MTSHPSPRQLAAYARRVAKKLDTKGGLALDRAGVLASRGYPASTNGGSRSSDTTSSTERAALTPGRHDGLDERLAARYREAWRILLDLEGMIDDVLAHATTADNLPPGTGYCCCGCETYCSPKQDGHEHRLKNGLAPSCHRRWLRWKDDGHPDGTVPDYCTAVRRAREKITEEQKRLAALRAELRVS